MTAVQKQVPGCFKYHPDRGFTVNTRRGEWTRADPEMLRRELVVAPGSQKMMNHRTSILTDEVVSYWFYLAQARHYGIEGINGKRRREAKAALTKAIKEAEGSLLRVPDRILKIASDLKLLYEKNKIEEQNRREERKKLEEEKKKRLEEELKCHTQSADIISRKRKADVMENVNSQSKKSRQDVCSAHIFRFRDLTSMATRSL